MALTANAIETPGSGATRCERHSALAELILARAAVHGGVTRAELARDLRSMTHPDLAPAAWRIRADAEIGELVRSGLVSEARSKMRQLFNARASFANDEPNRPKRHQARSRLRV